MRKCSGAILAALALNVVFGCAIVAVAQRTGGYKEVSRDDAEVEAAANFAVAERGRKQETSFTLVSIERAESQVVAGINYRLCLKVSTESDDEPQDVRVIVYRNLRKEYSLTSWEEESCGESDSEGNHASSVRTLNVSKSRAQNTDSLTTPAQTDDDLHTPVAGSAERKAILDAVREEYKEGDDHPAQFKVNYLKVHKGWAWIDVTPLNSSGKPVADPAPLLFQIDNGKWVSRDLNDVGMQGDEHEGPHDPSPKYIKALQKKYPGMPLDIIPKRHK
jgi:hypothetical protein